MILIILRCRLPFSLSFSHGRTGEYSKSDLILHQTACESRYENALVFYARH